MCRLVRGGGVVSEVWGDKKGGPRSPACRFTAGPVAMVSFTVARRYMILFTIYYIIGVFGNFFKI